MPFKQAFCDYFNCPPEDYLRQAFLRTLHRRARLFGRVLYWFEPSECLDLLEEAGKTTSAEDLLDVIKQSKYDEKERGSTLRQRLKLRVSGKRLLKINDQIRKSGS